MFLQRNSRQQLSLHQRICRQSAIHNRPFSLLPLHRSQVGFSSEMMIRTAKVAIGKEYHPPASVFGLNQVAMPGTLNLHRLSQTATVGKKRIVRITLVRSLDIPAPGDGKAMRQFGSTFRNEKIVIAVFLIDMRTFRITSTITLPQFLALCKLFARLWVYLTEPDCIARIAHHVAFSVFKIKRRIDALLLQPDRLAPRTTGISGCNHEVAAVAYIGGYHIVSSLMIADGRRIDAKPRTGTLQRNLTLTVEHITNLLPMNQILALEDWHTREILE